MDNQAPPSDPKKNGEAERIARAITGATAVHAVAYAAEAGQFQEAGFSTVVCGPGSIDQAHQPNEYIDIDQIDQCDRFLRRLMDDFSR